MDLPHWFQPLGGGVHAIDTGFQGDDFDAAYLIVDGGRAAFVDTGTAFALPRLLRALDLLGLPAHAVDWIIPTHVHLDHAGGVGPLARALPQAQVLVHPRGVRHMVDPSALYQGALAVYGQAEMDRSYGQLCGVPAERVQASHDDQHVALGGRQLRLIDTPGHARHHHCIWDPVTRGWFTGDTFGLSYRRFDVDGRAWILPTSTPVQFEPDALRQSIARLCEAAPERVYLTHYGALGDVAALARQLLDLLEQTVALALPLARASDRHTRLRQGLLGLYTRSLQAHGATLDESAVEQALALDIELNAQGLAIWLDRQAQA